MFTFIRISGSQCRRRFNWLGACIVITALVSGSLYSQEGPPYPRIGSFHWGNATPARYALPAQPLSRK